MPPDSRFAPHEVLDALAEAQVAFVVVGAFAGVLAGMPLRTQDLDVTPALDRDNLDRLANCLHELGATIRIRPHKLGPVGLPPDGGLLARAPILNLHLPDHGDLDVIHRAAERAGPAGRALDHAALAPAALTIEIAGVRAPVRVMCEADWLAAKRAAPVREKDRRHLELHAEWASGRARDAPG